MSTERGLHNTEHGEKGMIGPTDPDEHDHEKEESDNKMMIVVMSVKMVAMYTIRYYSIYTIP